MEQLPSITDVPTLPVVDRVRLLDILFEPCLQLHTLSVELLGKNLFASYDDLIIGIGLQLTELSQSKSSSDKAWLEAILAAHPRLGEKRIQSVSSQAEQAQLSTSSTQEVSELASLNAQYEARFPGLRYVVFVDGRPRSAIVQDMKARIARCNIEEERASAIKAMCQIASNRAYRFTSGQ